MKVRYSLVLVMLGILCIFPMIEFNSSVTVVTDFSSTDRPITRTSVALAQLTPHAPIDISSDSQFTALGFPGNGSESDPYRIEDLEILGTPGFGCITIHGSVLGYYEIRGCSILDSNPAPGISLSAGHGLIESCEIYNCSIGIVLESDGHNLVSTEIHNTSAAITSFDADNIVIEDSTFYDGNELFFDEASSLTITGNSFAGMQVSIGNGVGLTITDNTFDSQDTTDFLSIYDSQIGTIRGNVFNINSIAGLMIQRCDSLLIQECVFIASGPDGVGQQGIDSRGFDPLSDITIEDCTFQSVNCDASYIGEGLLLNDCTLTSGSIYLTSSVAGEVSNNIITSGGISLYNSSGSTIFNNTLLDCDYHGISARGNCTDVVISTNIIHGQGEADLFGLNLNSDEMIVHNNIIETFDRGIQLEASGCQITNNSVSDNNIGININEGSSSNQLYYNILYANTQNANDDGSNNIWDDGVSLGNYWSNLIAPGEYTIPGTADSVDRYAQPYRIAGSIPLVLIMVAGLGVVAVVGVVVCLKRK